LPKLEAPSQSLALDSLAQGLVNPRLPIDLKFGANANLIQPSASSAVGAGVKATGESFLNPAKPSVALLTGGVPKIISPAAIGSSEAASSRTCPTEAPPNKHGFLQL
jgi:hypothetical protein